MPRKSTHALEKSAKPYSQITDGKKVKTPGQANVPTKRQKTRMATLATSVIGGVYGKSIAMLAKNLGRPLVDKALNKIKGGSKKPTKKQITDILRVADQERKAGLLNKAAKKETDIHRPSPTHSTGRRGYKQLSGISNRDANMAKVLGRTQRGIQTSGIGAGIGAIHMTAKAKADDIDNEDKPKREDKPKLAPRPKSKPKQKKPVIYYKSTRGPTGSPRTGRIPGTAKDHDVKIDYSVLEKKRGGKIGCGVAKRGFGAVRKR